MFSSYKDIMFLSTFELCFEYITYVTSITKSLLWFLARNNNTLSKCIMKDIERKCLKRISVQYCIILWQMMKIYEYLFILDFALTGRQGRCFIVGIFLNINQHLYECTLMVTLQTFDTYFKGMICFLNLTFYSTFEESRYFLLWFFLFCIQLFLAWENGAKFKCESSTT